MWMILVVIVSLQTFETKALTSKNKYPTEVSCEEMLPGETEILKKEKPDTIELFTLCIKVPGRDA